LSEAGEFQRELVVRLGGSERGWAALMNLDSSVLSAVEAEFASGKITMTAAVELLQSQILPQFTNSRSAT
jgi:hypothetical protein